MAFIDLIYLYFVRNYLSKYIFLLKYLRIQREKKHKHIINFHIVENDISVIFIVFYFFLFLGDAWKRRAWMIVASNFSLAIFNFNMWHLTFSLFLQIQFFIGIIYNLID